MSNDTESNTAVIDPPPLEESKFNEEAKKELKLFVASRMFNTVSFQQVLATIDLQCRQQADQRVDAASEEDLEKLFADMQQNLESAYEQQANETEAAAQFVNSSDQPADECCEEPESCDNEDCDKNN
jgi:hypothetical protein